ncbi:ferrous iron transport protein B [Clostridium tetani]|uniref:ferrous iron transport protein B n=1 Tax=Clostridium tetani TaxID=1513 RepID=UPI0003C0D2B0|nr:ferrous iron transport protein B [Clostridium tetani]CDI48517.1 ferrous iron transport protein B [Clostridium tetani 12124569]
MANINHLSNINALSQMLGNKVNPSEDIVIALAGNPNTGKSTLFNTLTGLKQHTGNWTGKTVTTALGNYKFKDKNFVLVDLPGTYSLLSSSVEEEIARDFICFANPNATVVVTDSTCLERNLNLVLQVLEITDKVVVCVNLIDEAERKKIRVDIDKLSNLLGVPVVATNARSGKGLEDLMDAIYKVSYEKIKNNPIKIVYNDDIEKRIESLENKIDEFNNSSLSNRWIALKLLDENKNILNSMNKYLNFDYNLLSLNRKEDKDLRDDIVLTMISIAENISKEVVTFENDSYNEFDRKIDDILTSKKFGIPVMIALLALTFWITIEGANVPSEMLANIFNNLEKKLTAFFMSRGLEKLHGPLILGVYRTLGWVISVMLPPMAIFFPLFTLLEDLGYLPRVAFNLDNFFKKACAHGKQALTMCMGFGCNAAGVIGCRIIDSPRERLIAIITNTFVPCNGRFPILISITMIFIASNFAGSFNGVIAALTVTFVIILGIIATLLSSRLLSKTLLKGEPSSFTLELPPYRKPKVGQILVRSILDRTFFVLARAIIVAAPAGLILWFFANTYVGDNSILQICANFLNPFAQSIGMDGYILLAFILGLPANEIVIPIIIMSYMSAGALIEFQSLSTLRELLIANGWTIVTAINVMIFTLMHFPCGTTLLTIRKETGSLKWTLVSFLLPTLFGIIVCFLVTQTFALFL